jgi:hypothetical protein
VTVADPDSPTITVSSPVSGSTYNITLTTTAASGGEVLSGCAFSVGINATIADFDLNPATITVKLNGITTLSPAPTVAQTDARTWSITGNLGHDDLAYVNLLGDARNVLNISGTDLCGNPASLDVPFYVGLLFSGTTNGPLVVKAESLNDNTGRFTSFLTGPANIPTDLDGCAAEFPNGFPSITSVSSNPADWTLTCNSITAPNTSTADSVTLDTTATPPKWVVKFLRVNYNATQINNLFNDGATVSWTMTWKYTSPYQGLAASATGTIKK